MKSGAPVLPVSTYTDPQGKTHVIFEEPIQVSEANADRDLQIMQMVIGRKNTQYGIKRGSWSK